jgi:hypothetical protein
VSGLRRRKIKPHKVAWPIKNKRTTHSPFSHPALPGSLVQSTGSEHISDPTHFKETSRSGITSLAQSTPRQSVTELSSKRKSEPELCQERMQIVDTEWSGVGVVPPQSAAPCQACVMHALAPGEPNPSRGMTIPGDQPPRRQLVARGWGLLARHSLGCCNKSYAVISAASF